MADPEEITIIVHSAKGLQGKKSGRHKFSVIFGLGGTKFRTAVVKDPTGNPEWNEETIVHVSNVLDQIFFIATEKDDIIGQISIPVTSLKNMKGQIKRMPLQPHKKCPSPQGELLYQCYISKYRAPGNHVPIIRGSSGVPDEVRPQSAFKRLRQRMQSPVTQRKASKEKKEQKTGSLANFNKKFSRSIQDLFSFSKFSAGESINIDDNVSMTSQKSNSKKDKNRRKFSLSFLSMGSDLDKTGGEDPVILSVTPNVGPIDHPTRLTIEGRNLGIGKSDILSLKIAGCDCTDTLEFQSSSRIYCTTHFWKVGKGPVVIDTISGGIGTLKDGFCFYEDLDANQNTHSTNPFENDMGSEHGKADEESNGRPNFIIGGREIKSGSQTLPRIRNSALLSADRSPGPSSPTAPPRYQKKGNHARHSSESVIIASKQPPVETVSKEELQARIVQLETENAALKKDNAEMKTYIDKLVAKCMLHCPEALAQDPNEKGKLFVL